MKTEIVYFNDYYFPGCMHKHRHLNPISMNRLDKDNLIHPGYYYKFLTGEGFSYIKDLGKFLAPSIGNDTIILRCANSSDLEILREMFKRYVDKKLVIDGLPIQYPKNIV